MATLHLRSALKGGVELTVGANDARETVPTPRQSGNEVNATTETVTVLKAGQVLLVNIRPVLSNAVGMVPVVTTVNAHVKPALLVRVALSALWSTGIVMLSTARASVDQ